MNPLVVILLLTNAFLFTQMTHPMSMGLILLIQTLLTCIITGSITKSFWFSYILFLIFIGGMLILFIYMASLASNEKFLFTSKMVIKLGAGPFLITFFLFIDNFWMHTSYYNNEINTFNTFSMMLKENFLPVSKMFDCPNNFIILFLIIYLLLNLIIIVKITNIFSGPLRTKNL